jgi:thymidylate synthase (FAD)
MKVRLIATTQSHVSGVATPEELIVHNARVSNPGNQLNMQTAGKLLAFCMRHGHWSIFEQADMTVEIQTSRVIAAQLLRHRSFTFQEFSQRYSEATEFEPVELRRQAESNRQSSTEVMDDEHCMFLVNQAIYRAETAYRDLLTEGVARECARMVLPLCTTTTLYMKGSCRSWIHYLQQRLSEHTQKEHREVAQEVARIFASVFPTVSKLIDKN